MVSADFDKRRPRDTVIDGFRGIAILSVMSYHFSARWAPPEAPRDVYGYHYVAPGFLHLGYLGVELFFVISGLVITMTVLRSQSTLDFAIRRFGRLTPPYLAGLALTIIASLILPWPREFAFSWLTAIENIALPLLPFEHSYVDGVYWSLAVEIKFYALVALGFFCVKRWFWTFVVVVSASECLVHWAGHHIEFLAPWTPLFLIGMAAWMGKKERDWRAAGTLLFMAVIQLATTPCFSRWTGGHFEAKWEDTLFLVVTVGLMVALFVAESRIAPAILVRIGRFSYSLYLIHQKIGVALIALLVSRGLPGLPVAVAVALLCMVAAQVLWRHVEGPGDDAIQVWTKKLLRATEHYTSARRRC